MSSTIGIVLFFALALVAGILVHLDRPATRRLVADRVNGVLDGALAGKVRIERIGGLGLGGIDGVRVRVHDPDGVPVLRAEGVQVHVATIAALRSALFGKGPIDLHVTSLSIDNADVNVDSGPNGDLRLARAFAPKKSSPSPTPPSPPGRGVRVSAPIVRLGHAWAHGTMAGAPPIDDELSTLSGRASIDTAVPTGASPIVNAEVSRVRLVARALPRHADPSGMLRGTFAMPAMNGNGVAVRAVFDGAAFGVPTTIEAGLEDRHLDARLDLQDSSGAQAGLAISELAIKEPLVLHAEAHGDLPVIESKATLSVGKASVVANATTVATSPASVRGTVRARNVDVAAIVPHAPRTQLGLDAHAELAFQADGPHGEVAIDTLPGQVDQQSIPPVAVRGRLEGAAAAVEARIADPNMPTEVDVEVAPRAGAADARVVRANVRSQIKDLHRLPVVGAKLAGKAEVEASARVLLPEKRLADAAAHVTATRLQQHDFELALDKLETTARAHGTLQRPVIDAHVEGTHLAYGTIGLASLDAGARIEVATGDLTVRDAHAHLVRPLEGTLDVKARTVRVAGPNLRVEGAEVLGVGDPIEADMAKTPFGIEAKIDAPKIDLATVSRLAGKKDFGVKSGVVTVKGEGSLRRGVAHGNMHVELGGLTVRSIKNARGVIDATIDDRDLEVAINANVDKAGSLDLHTHGFHIDGRVDDPRAWRRAHGRVRLAGAVNLYQVANFAPPGALPVADMSGNVTVIGSVGRDGPEVPPEISLHAYSNGLALAARSAPPKRVDGVEVETPPRWRLTDVDFGVDLRTDGTSGLTSFAARATDRAGALVALDAKTFVPFAEIEENPAVARARLVEAPVNLRVNVPPRRIQDLPPIAAIQGARGSFDADLLATGTIDDPRFRLVARTHALHTAAMPLDMDADTDVVLDYDGQKADLSAKVLSHGRQLLDAAAHLDARVHDFFVAAKTKQAPPWRANARASLAAFPIESVPQLADHSIRGRASGEIKVDDLHSDGHAVGRINLDGLVIGDAEYTKGTIAVDARNGKLAANVRLDQKDGFLEAKAATGIVWGAALAPSLDTHQPIEASLDAAAFRAAAVQPFVDTILPVVDGRIDANATAKIVPGTPGAALAGKVVFRDGTLQVAALGEELRGVRATASFAPDGTIRIGDVHARGARGEVSADGLVKLDGVRLDDATVNVRIPTRHALAVAVQGQPVGEVSGTIKLEAKQPPGANDTQVVVEVPSLMVELPKVTKSGVQSLDEKENIHVGVYRDRARDRFVMLPLQEKDIRRNNKSASESRLDVDVRLGKILISRGNQLRVNLTGNPKLSMENGETTLRGRIELRPGGWVDVQGKKFELEKGTITFNGETPPDPIVVATAGWTAADGTRVYADFIGPVSKGKINLRSEPARPQNEILALILFGTVDGANPQPAQAGQQSDGTTKAAVGLGGGLVAQGLTEALEDLSGIQVTARIDSTQANNPRPELEFQVSPKVSLAFSYVIGTPPIAQPDKNFANLEYRFHRNWSLDTTVGDHGTALIDAIWQKRY